MELFAQPKNTCALRAQRARNPPTLSLSPLAAALARACRLRCVRGRVGAAALAAVAAAAATGDDEQHAALRLGGEAATQFAFSFDRECAHHLVVCEWFL